MSEEVKLNLGANQRPQPGYVNVDIVDYPGIDVVCDLEKRWPWDDDSVDEVSCADLPEHLRQWWEEPDPELFALAERQSGDGEERAAVTTLIQAMKRPRRTYGIIHFMNEAWRVLKPGGALKALIPSTDGRGWAQDPTHVSYWNENSILYFIDTPHRLREIYPRLIKCRWRNKFTGTQPPNTLGISWIRIWLEKLP